MLYFASNFIDADYSSSIIKKQNDEVKELEESSDETSQNHLVWLNKLETELSLRINRAQD